MKKVLVMSMVVFLTLAGCASKDIKETAIPQDKIYTVIFEGDPKIIDKQVRSSSDIIIGDILQETPNGSDLTLVKISIEEAHTPMIQSNTVFVATDGYLKSDTVGKMGEPVSEGGRLLGFTGKTKLLWFKTKAKVSGLSKATKNKAAELYNRVR
ncbi:MAG: hypothetical protein V3V31_12500 [Methylococcales bacterium]